MVSTAMVPLNWFHSKIISGATFRIIGLTKIPKIEFLPLDWIYRSIRINTVLGYMLSITIVQSYTRKYDKVDMGNKQVVFFSWYYYFKMAVKSWLIK